jgi:iron(III) transport system substrate-binding protein
VYDTEETKSTGLVNRLVARKDNPDGDLFWSGDPARAALLKAKGVTAAYEPPGAEDIAETYKDPARHWVGFSARCRVLLVNNILVPTGEEPTTLWGLTSPKWKGRVAVANPLFGTTSFQMAAIFETLGEQRARAWLTALKANDVQIVASNGEVKRQVSSGAAAVGLADSDDAIEAIKDGQPVRIVFLDQVTDTEATGLDHPLGTLVIPNTVSIIRGGPNVEGAKRVAGFLVSREAQRMLAVSCAQAPLTPGITADVRALDLNAIVPMRVDYGAIAQRLDALMPLLKKWSEEP